VELIPTRIEGAMLIKPQVYGDARGFFMESWNAETFGRAGLPTTFVQDNHSRSAKGVLRGLHYQHPGAQGKLMRVVHGAVYDVLVDLRRPSPTFGQWIGVELSAANQLMLWAPPGMAHGFLSLSDGTELLYKCTEFYQPGSERCLRWNDPAIGIDWPLECAEPLLSRRDAQGDPFAEAITYQ
jgi:dTDP-4-dehydrorhamnose 3,5-epimerase